MPLWRQLFMPKSLVPSCSAPDDIRLARDRLGKHAG
jgi:hypothetical protein